MQKTENEKLILACRNHNYNQIKQLLEHGADPNSKDRNDNAIILSCRNIKTLRLLLDHGADYNAFDDHGHVTIFGFSIWYYKYKCCKLLIERGYDVNKKSYYGTYLFDALCILQSPWYKGKRSVTVVNNIIEIIKLLLKHVNKETLAFTGEQIYYRKTFMEAIKPRYLVMLFPEFAVTEGNPEYKLY